MKPNILLIYRKIMLTVMRKSLLMALAIFFACTAHLSAAPVTKADALTGAKAFMKAKGVAFEGKLQNVGGPGPTMLTPRISMFSTTTMVRDLSSCLPTTARILFWDILTRGRSMYN